ncbi:MAG: N-acetyltransferase [Sulfuriflexus sp.]|nr:N-acetyltransferase [Sulfuriflexus sp.]
MYETKIITCLDDIPAQQWNALQLENNPFISYEFLSALENYDCLQKWGWQIRFVCLYEDKSLIASVPMYLKDNSYGEFVFDSAWADAYSRHGLRYYPKLVVAVPFTPATGPRLLLHKDHANSELRTELINATLDYAKTIEVSSLHYLFTPEAETNNLEKEGLLRRTGCQFHWQNNAYTNFDDFLASLSSKKRKQIRKERRDVNTQGVEIELLHGKDTQSHHWDVFYNFYKSTFARKSGYATLTREFFEALSENMPDQVILVLAKHNGEYVAATFNLLGDDTLYGRHWGCSETFSGLHFELCYYQLIDYCIKHGIQRFEAGAQGEHKLSRGFLPTPTWSAHWLAHPEFNQVIAEFLQHEHKGMQDYMDVLDEHSPFKNKQ